MNNYQFKGPSKRYIAGLAIHPLNLQVYGEPKPDAAHSESIKQHGILKPIVVDNGGRILDGARRWKASKDLGLKEVPTLELLATDDYKLICELFVIEANHYRDKTPELKTREFMNLKRIEAELAKQRSFAHLRQGTQIPDPANLPDRENKGDTRDIAAKKVGLKPKTAEKLEKVVQKADSGDPAARQVLDEVNSGARSVDSAFKEVTGKAQSQPNEPPLEHTALAKMACQLHQIASNLSAHLEDQPYPRLVEDLVVRMIDDHTTIGKVLDAAWKTYCTDGMSALEFAKSAEKPVDDKVKKIDDQHGLEVVVTKVEAKQPMADCVFATEHKPIIQRSRLKPNEEARVVV